MYCDIKLMLTCWVLYHILHFFIHGPSDVFLINNQSGFIACDPDEVFAITDSRGGGSLCPARILPPLHTKSQLWYNYTNSRLGVNMVHKNALRMRIMFTPPTHLHYALYTRRGWSCIWLSALSVGLGEPPCSLANLPARPCISIAVPTVSNLQWDVRCSPARPIATAITSRRSDGPAAANAIAAAVCRCLLYSGRWVRVLMPVYIALTHGCARTRL